MSRIRTIGKDIQSRAQYVARLLHEQLKVIGEEAHEEHWDGRELFSGLGLAFAQACQAMNYSPADGIRMINGMDIPEADTRDMSMLVQPNGRPLTKVV